MLAEIQINKSESRVYAMDERWQVIATYKCGCDFYDGYNENGEPYCNAPDGVYNDESVWAEAKGVDNGEPPYGWAYINIDSRGHALHGGGSNLGSGYNEPFQSLTPTLGCFRMYNADVYHLALMFLEAQNMGTKPCITVVS